MRFGSETGYRGRQLSTILLREVKDVTGSIVCDHLWFNLTKGFAALGPLTEGEVVEFHARSKPYVRGYKGRDWERQLEAPLERDFKLSHQFKVKIVWR